MKLIEALAHAQLESRGEKSTVYVTAKPVLIQVEGHPYCVCTHDGYDVSSTLGGSVIATYTNGVKQ